ncbi:MAG: peptide ABC transporter substrate-binding protein [Chloroflexi bacterium]|nr:peptide ABC transporter substrate-binding protein [Chloroflexota bacterium]
MRRVGGPLAIGRRGGRLLSRLAAGFLLLGLLLPLITACSAVRDSIGGLLGGSSGVLRLSGVEPDTLDPAVAQDVVSWTYLLQIYSGLVRLDDKLQVVPDLAQSWTVSPDRRTYTFTLRSDARFQDGRPITAEDVKYSLERALDPATRSPVARTYLGDIVGAVDRLRGTASSVAGITVVDARTVRITIDAPKSYFLAKLTYPTAFVVDRRNVAAGPDWFRHPNASGRFTLKSWTPGQEIVLTHNPGYWGQPSGPSEIDFYFGPDSPLSLYEQNKLDVATVGVGDVPRLTDPSSPYHDQLVVTPMMTLWYIGFNTKQKPFDDPRVRLAFAYATNKKALANGLFRGTRTVAQGILPPGLAGYDAGFTGVPFDPTRARALLAQSSYHSAANLPPITLSVSAGSGPLGEAFARMYEETLGVHIAVEELENTFFDDLAAHRLQMYYLGWSADYPDPQDFLDILFSGQSDANYSGYDDPTVNRLLATAATEASMDRRIALYREVQRKVIEDAPVIPVVFDTEYTLVRPTVHGLTITPLGIVSFDGVRVGT